MSDRCTSIDALSAHPEFDDHACVAFFVDRPTGTRAIIAIHRQRHDDGPSVGGCRMIDYMHESDALTDVLRLSKGMSAKCTVTGLPYGGAKAVVIGRPTRENREATLRAVAGFVDTFHGRFRTGVDVGLTADDVAVMAQVTAWTVGTGPVAPDALTARGVYVCLERAVQRRLGRSSLDGVRVGVQGLGKVGGRLAAMLLDAGASVMGGDIERASNDRAAELGVRIVPPERVHSQDIDVFAPCALGAVLNDRTIPELTAKVVAGAANNQLANDAAGRALHDRGILYVPDYLANAGGLIAVAMQIENQTEAWAWAKADCLADQLDTLIDAAQAAGTSMDQTSHDSSLMA